MAEVNRDSGTVNARILYWGVEGGGKSTNLRVIHQKLRPDHRGDLQTRRTRLDPTVTYEVLPIALGDVAGQRTTIEVCAFDAPLGAEIRCGDVRALSDDAIAQVRAAFLDQERAGLALVVDDHRNDFAHLLDQVDLAAAKGDLIADLVEIAHGLRAFAV